MAQQKKVNNGTNEDGARASQLFHCGEREYKDAEEEMHRIVWDLR